METLELIINKKVEILWNKEVYRSTIQDVNDEFFAISIPTKDGEYIPFKAGEIAEVIYYKELSIFQFDCKVLGRKVEEIPIILLEIPEEYKVVQRREYFRVNKLDYLNYIDVAQYETMENLQEFKKDATSSETEKSALIFKKAVLLDLSGGGMRVRLNEKVKNGDVLHFFLKTNKDEMELYGKVVRVELDDDKYYDCGICFLDITKIEREKIIRYTFDIMRDQRSKGL